MVKNKAKDLLHGLMAQPIKGNFMTIIQKEKVFIVGLTDEFTKVLGKIIKCMVMGYSPGLTGGNMKGNTPMIRNKAEGPSFGLMGENIVEAG